MFTKVDKNVQIVIGRFKNPTILLMIGLLVYFCALISVGFLAISVAEYFNGYNLDGFETFLYLIIRIPFILISLVILIVLPSRTRRQRTMLLLNTFYQNLPLILKKPMVFYPLCFVTYWIAFTYFVLFWGPVVLGPIIQFRLLASLLEFSFLLLAIFVLCIIPFILTGLSSFSTRKILAVFLSFLFYLHIHPWLAPEDFDDYGEFLLMPIILVQEFLSVSN